jgi:NADH-quinone oxidoreductase subunit H
MNFLSILYYILVMPGFLFTAFTGLLSTWIDRKVTARLQWRQGPRIYQPFADIIKLLGKEIMIPEGASKLVFLSAPLIGIAAVTLVSTMLWILNINIYGSFVGDLIVIYYLLTIPCLAHIIGGSASRNPLSAMGVSRETKLILAYELPFIIAIATVIAKTGSILMGSIIGYQSTHGMLIGSVSGIIAFIVSLLVVQAKLGFVPFDISEAEQEIMAGTLLEYSGAPLAVFRLTNAMLLFTLPVLLITLFLGGIDTFSIAGALWFVLKYFIVLALIILIKNTNPRIRVDQAVRFFWGPVTVMAVIGFILAVVGR